MFVLKQENNQTTKASNSLKEKAKMFVYTIAIAKALCILANIFIGESESESN